MGDQPIVVLIPNQKCKQSVLEAIHVDPNPILSPENDLFETKIVYISHYFIIILVSLKSNGSILSKDS